MYVRSQGIYLPFDTLRLRRSLQRGVSLVELILFIVIISVAVAGILLVMNRVSGHSADALLRKQSMAIAESLLEEIQLQNFTKPAGGFAGPYTPANRINFDCVTDYNGFTTAGIFSLNNTAITELARYNVIVAVVPAALGAIAAANSVLITVSVTDPQGNLPVQISGYRTAY
jgi:MSHA pilin protein MshD